MPTAQGIEGYNVWKHSGDLGAFETVAPVIDLQHGGPGWAVTIDNAPADGSPFATIKEVVNALNAHVFVSLEADAESGLYDVDVEQDNKIRKATGENPFEDYSNGTSVADAVEQAISGLDLTGSNNAQHAPHERSKASFARRPDAA